jgi:hypothetical protein
VVSRVVSAAIVCFWVVMSFLLIRLEIHPDTSDLLSLQPSHVFKIMFTHQQISDLTIMQDGKPIGNFMLHPKIDATPGERSLLFSGGFSFLPPGAQRKQRLSWDGEVVMDNTFKMLGMTLTAGLQDPPYRVRLEIDPAKTLANYEVMMGTHTLKRSSIPMNQDGVSALLRDELGIDTGVLQHMPVTLGSPTLTAKQTELRVRKENIVAYLLTFKAGETTVAEIYVSQLGQVLSAKLIGGYELTTEDLSPQ